MCRPSAYHFPEDIRKDPYGDVSRKEFGACCGSYTVLSDFWKDQAMRLGINNRSDWFKLDFNAEGYIQLRFWCLTRDIRV